LEIPGSYDGQTPRTAWDFVSLIHPSRAANSEAGHGTSGEGHARRNSGSGNIAQRLKSLQEAGLAGNSRVKRPHVHDAGTQRLPPFPIRHRRDTMRRILSAQNQQSSELPSIWPPRGSQAEQIRGLDQQSSELPSIWPPRGSQAEQIRGLETALAQAATNESNLKIEIKTLKTTLTHALSSEREMRASARDTREEWERVERSLREEIGVLRKSLGNTEKELVKVKKELQGKTVVPVVQRLIQGKGRLVEEMITLEEPPWNVCAEVEEECVPSFPG